MMMNSKSAKKISWSRLSRLVINKTLICLSSGPSRISVNFSHKRLPQNNLTQSMSQSHFNVEICDIKK